MDDMSESKKAQLTNQPGSWMSLPPELRIMILKHVDESDIPDDPSREPPQYLAACAAVSKEWQIHFEAVTFRNLELNQDDLDKLVEYVPPRSHRIDLLRSVHLRLVLGTYCCRYCASREDEWERDSNDSTLTDAVWKLFNAMAAWGNPRPRPLELELSAHSPSDWQHAFMSLRFRALDRHRGGRKKLEAAARGAVCHGPSHHWSSGLRDRAPRTNEWRRVQGSGLQLDDDWSTGERQPRLPRVLMVGLFLIRRQFYRRFTALGCLGRIIEALPNLYSFCYEPWRASPASPRDVERQRCHYLNLVHILGRYPYITKVSIFEDFGDLDGYLRSPDESPRQRDRTIGRLLAMTSRTREYASFSFMADAADFFYEFWPETEAHHHHYPAAGAPARWEKLAHLCLTSDLLHPSGDIDGLLNAAARAAMLMPRLRRLTLWRAGRGQGCFFQYSIAPTGRPEIRMASTWGARLDPQTEKLWTRVASQWRPRFSLLIFHFQLREGDMGSHGSILWMLREPSVATWRSQEQLLSEGLAKSKFAATRPGAVVANSMSLIEGTLLLKIQCHRGGGLELAYEFSPRATRDGSSVVGQPQFHTDQIAHRILDNTS